MTQGRIVIIIPTLNEEGSIGNVIDEIPFEQLQNMGYDSSVLVVDGNSSDRTSEIAIMKNALIFTQQGKGKGSGVRQAFKLSDPEVVVKRVLGLTNMVNVEFKPLVALLDADYVIMLDGDGTYPGEQIPAIVAALEKGYDAVMGSRFLGEIEEGAMSFLNRIGNHLLCAIASSIYLRRTSDLCTGMWGFKTNVLKEMALNSKGFELEAEMFAELVKHDWTIKEIPISYRCRDGETKLIPMKAGLAIALKIFERRLMRSENGRSTLSSEVDIERPLAKKIVGRGN